MPPSEHEQRDGYLHRVYVCDNAPFAWRGVFVDRPVRALVCEEHPDLPWPHGDCAGPGMLREDVES
jgi:hypothetical protein